MSVAVIALCDLVRISGIHALAKRCELDLAMERLLDVIHGPDMWAMRQNIDAGHWHRHAQQLLMVHAAADSTIFICFVGYAQQESLR